MCGIIGKYNFHTGEPVSPDLIKAMCDKVIYRGPDDGGVYTDGHIGLGHRRLSILDLSELGHQPMSSEDGQIWITYNGEIYNFQLLREGLIAKGYTFKSDCDTEVLICLYQEYGTSCLKYLRGMFAFAIWDKRNSRLFLARDRIGKKPLFYYDDGKTFVFASEIKSILEDPQVRKEMNHEAFYDYFKYLYVPDPKTIYKNIHKLEAGHYLICTPEGVGKSKEYWDVSFAKEHPGSLEDISDELLHILDESVRLRMISDVPLGAFLSGGIDSSGVVALMAKQQNNPVTTCAIGFDSEAFDEIQFARKIAIKYRTHHHEFTVKQKAEDILTDLAYYFDEPFADSSAIPTFFVSQLARQKVTVALSGDGGDENFAGYEKYYMDDIENRIRSKIPGFVRKPFFPFLSRLISKRDHILLKKGSTLLNTLGYESDYGFYLTNSEFEDSLWDQVIRENTKKRIGDYDPFSVTQHYYHKADTDDHISKILYTDLKTYLSGILVKVDRMSMANSLEVRSPILDHEVIEFAASVPPNLKYNRGEKKYILKQSFRQILPKEIMHRKKMGFSVPMADWFRGELKDLAKGHLFDKESGLREFFHVRHLETIWEAHQAGRRNYATILWSLLMFELWHKTFMRS